ncbi:hypothetical protein MMC07_002391 [Pseudocyphellaria aurata]|nr:hypothetical protein [Pseudocyphellaria aurata]
MRPLFIIGVVHLMAVVNSAPVTDGLNPDGTFPFLGDQLDSELNFQPLPKIVTSGPVHINPESGAVTSGSISKPSLPKTITSAANSEPSPHRSNATSPEPAPKRDYFQENDFKCSKEASLIGCCDGGAFDKCEICNYLSVTFCLNLSV